jgi:hypothetical protein
MAEPSASPPASSTPASSPTQPPAAAPSHLPDDQLPVPQHRTRRESVRAEGAGQHLHPHHEPHHRRAGTAHRQTWRGVSGPWPPAVDTPPKPWLSLRCARRATTSSAAAGSTGARTTSSTTPCRAWASTSPSSTRPIRQLRAGHPAPTPRSSTARRWATPTLQGLPLRGSGRHRQRVPHPADDRQHPRHALPLPSLRVGRTYRGPQHHQVLGGHGHPSAASSWMAATSTGAAAASLTSPPPTKAITVWSTPTGRHGAAALRHQGARPGPARHRRLPVPVQQLEHVAGIETLSLRMERHVQNARAWPSSWPTIRR